jgi:hypothetical protein
MGENEAKKYLRRVLTRSGLCLACLYLVLLIPEGTAQNGAGAGKKPFEWNQDEVWTNLQHVFVQARSGDKAVVSNRIAELQGKCRRLLAGISKDEEVGPEDPRWLQLENNLFILGPLVAAQPSGLLDYADLANGVRRATKLHSALWDMHSDQARERIYRLLFGSRLAMEEVLLQNPETADHLAVECDAEPSQTPSVVFRGVKLHSGDILVSRGSAPTSALISRGNDYAGSFSHVSLLHVESATGAASIIHSLIEKGVVISPLADYGKDRKLRLMVLRPRASLPEVKADPQVPHKAAAAALDRARTGHVPYDFLMNYRDHSSLFCSEVVSAAYEQHGLHLWMGMSHISSPNTIAWLGSLGVRHFETQEPADLEYDPQLCVVAEWRESDALWQAHLDDAVTDAMLALAHPGKPLPFSRWKLPFARGVKAWSVVMYRLGGEGKIPEGMSATTALRADRYRANHAEIKARLMARATAYKVSRGYSAPYWELVRMAKEAHGRDRFAE